MVAGGEASCASLARAASTETIENIAVTLSPATAIRVRAAGRRRPPARFARGSVTVFPLGGLGRLGRVRVLGLVRL